MVIYGLHLISIHRFAKAVSGLEFHLHIICYPYPTYLKFSPRYWVLIIIIENIMIRHYPVSFFPYEDRPSTCCRAFDVPYLLGHFCTGLFVRPPRFQKLPKPVLILAKPPPATRMMGVTRPRSPSLGFLRKCSINKLAPNLKVAFPSC